VLFPSSPARYDHRLSRRAASVPLHERAPRGEVAQLVEHTTENRSVDSSILSLATTKLFPFTDLAIRS
jgi:hypothetical protein